MARKIKAILEAEDRSSPTFNRVAGAVAALGAAAVAVGVVALGRKLVSGIQAATKAASIQEDAEIKVAQALRLVGETSGEALAGVKDLAAGLQNLTGVGDETILTGQALLITMGRLTGEGLERATKAALDMAAVTGNTASAFDLVAKASVGYTSTLSRYGIILDQTIPQAEKFDAALTKIEELFGGTAQALLQSYSGRLRELKGRFGDLQETIGGPFREVLTEVFGTVLSPTIKDIDDFRKANDGSRQAVLTLGIALAEVTLAIVLFGEKVTQSKIFGLGLGLAMVVLGTEIVKLKSSMGLLGIEIADVNDENSELSQRIQELVRRLEELRATGAVAADELVNSLGAASDAADALVEKVKSVPEEVLELAEAVRQGIEDGFDALNARIEGTRTRIEQLDVAIKRMLRQAAVEGALQLGDALVDAALAGKFAFGDFFRQLLKDLAKAIVQALILRAILASFGGGGGSFGSLASFTGFSPGGFQKGGIVGAQRGLIAGIGRVPGIDRGGDTTLIAGRPGEAVLPAELTSFLLQAAAGGTGPQTIIIEVRTNLPAAVQEINDLQRRGAVSLTATRIAGSRITR